MTGSAALEWENYVNHIEPAPGRRDYVMHFINPPVPERANSVDDTRCLLREPVKNVAVELNPDGSETAKRAWLLDPWNPDNMKPVQVTTNGRQVRMDLPDSVAIWSVVVLECDVR
jgi:hypothetical protein